MLESGGALEFGEQQKHLSRELDRYGTGIDQVWPNLVRERMRRGVLFLGDGFVRF